MSLNITVLRHGKADKTLPNHRLHPLSIEGFAQAGMRRRMLGMPKYDLIITSPLLRAKQTGITVAGINEDPAYDNRVAALNSLYPDDNDPRMAALDKVFNELGHAPLKDYERHVKNDLDSLAQEMKADIWDMIVGAFCCGDRIRNVLVVGHAILIPALCRTLTGWTVPFSTDVLGECEGYVLKATDMKLVELDCSLK